MKYGLPDEIIRSPHGALPKAARNAGRCCPGFHPGFILDFHPGYIVRRLPDLISRTDRTVSVCAREGFRRMLERLPDTAHI
jgi:hypothetical protein